MAEPAISDAYHKARRQFTLFSGILIVWEYIGVSVGKELKAPGVDFKVSIERPEIIPMVIFLLVLYFGIRFTIEWQRGPAELRQKKSSIIDATITYIIGLSACTIFALQWYVDFRLFDSGFITYFYVLVVTGMISGVITKSVHAVVRPKRYKFLYEAFTIVVVVLAWLLITMLFSIQGSIFLVGAGGIVLFPYAMRYRKHYEKYLLKRTRESQRRRASH